MPLFFLPITVYVSYEWPQVFFFGLWLSSTESSKSEEENVEHWEFGKIRVWIFVGQIAPFSSVPTTLLEHSGEKWFRTCKSCILYLMILTKKFAIFPLFRRLCLCVQFPTNLNLHYFIFLGKAFHLQHNFWRILFFHAV